MSHKCKEDCENGQHADKLPASGNKFTFREPTMGEMKLFLGVTPILAAPDPTTGAPTIGEAAGDASARWEEALQMCCTLSLVPRYVDGEKPPKEGELLLDDLIFRDVVFMIAAMTAAAGLDAAQAEADPT